MFENTAQDKGGEAPQKGGAGQPGRGLPSMRPDIIQPAFQQNSEEEPKKRNAKKAIAIVVGVIVFIAMGIGAFALYFQYRNNPEDILLEAVAASKNISSVTAEFSAKIKFTERDGALWNAEVISSGNYAFGESAIFFQMKNIANVNSSNAEDSFGPVDVDFLVPQKNAAYAKINAFPVLGFFSLEKLYGKWIKMDLADLKGNTTIGGVEVPPESAMDAYKKEVDELREKMLLAYAHNPFLIFSKQPIQDILGVESYHYTFTVDAEKLKGFLAEAEAAASSNIEEATGGAYEEVYAGISQEVDEFFNENEITGEVWIGKVDKYFRKISVTTKNISEAAANDDFGMITESTFAVQLSNFNAQFEFVEPSDFMSMEEAIEELTGFQMKNISPVSLPEDTTLDGADYDEYILEDDTDKDGLPDYLERSLGTDVNNPDTDGDGYMDGEEFYGGYNPLGEGKIQ